MSRTSKRYLLVVFPLVVMLAAGLGIATHGFGLYAARNSVGLQETGSSPQYSDVSRLSTYRIPDSLDFCGERMPLEIPDVRRRMEWAFYTNLSDAQIILDLKRSTEYFPYIESQLQEMNLPEDLKYLPVAESALRDLVSSRGAAGIWQFTEETAKRYGLVLNNSVDERYNFRKATRAALSYLSDLHAAFGSWTLAAAAYNMGRTGTRLSIDYQMVNDYYNLYLNDETSRFVFRIVALKQIMSHYRTYGFDLTSEDFYQAPETRTISVAHIPNLAVWARQQGTSYKEVKYLNPWLISQTLPYGDWRIDLPKSSQPVVFASTLPVTADSASDTKPNLKYVVKRGDSLIRIAKTYGVSVKDLVDWNDLGDRRYLRTGEKLVIFANDQDIER